ncbi:HMG high mobility group box-containing protein [Nitzschia inconspicua]|uniref:HMG high mobility group box-containing protein n=1 Tax=Nitzschia inconspicua TaxID=303405 RepID=A0A9K3Q123_9STRA|nr:HMG high mobility group box-containing protein [Nitzschia inconspicua]
MNIAPTDASKAPYAASGEIVDRTQGILPGAAAGGEGRLEDLKKSSSGGSPESSRGSDLKKKAMDHREKGTMVEDEDNDDVASDFKTGTDAAEIDKLTVKKRRARKKWKKPRDKPNRPLSAYNLFFQKERARMLGDEAEKHDNDKGKKRVHRKTHGKIGFAEMARVIGAKWKTLDDEEKQEFEGVAAKEKARYAKELAVWKEEQKRKEEEARKASKGERGSSKKEDVKVERVPFTPEQEMGFRMQMMANRGGFPFFGTDAHQRQQMPTIDYLRSMQEERATSMFGGGPFMGDSVQQQFPNASEASANALLNQFQGPPQGSLGMDGSGGGISDYQQLQMARMQMINSSMMGGPMGVGMMGSTMGMGGGFPPMNDLEFQRLQQMRMMQGMNQMDASNSGMSGSNESHQGGPNSIDAAMMRRFQNRFGGGM